MAPWIFLLFMGLLDFGFYAYAIISVENAARVGAQYTSTGPSTAADTAGACFQVLEELRMMPNVPTNLAICTATPVQVTVTALPGVACPEGIATSDGCTEVAVTYTTIPLFPLPGLTGQLTITRRVMEMVKPL